MLFLILSIICSVTVGVIFKITRKYNVNNSQIVAANYLFAIILCYLFFSPNLKSVDTESPWTLYIVIGLLLPSVFLFLAASIKHMGIVKTDAAQRLSLFIPILAAWLIFKEDFNSLKIIAFLIGLPAILLILSKPSENTKNKWIYPAIVLLGFGLIDILFKQIASYTTLPYTTSLFVVFCIALLIMVAVVIYEWIANNVRLQIKNIAFGGLVGFFNFGNILFYLKAHQAFSENPSTVFAGMNMGVIILGSLLGIFVFKEKLSKINLAGLFLALIAVVLIVLSQIK
ncbi:DMT family transporter [Flavobacterium sp. I-SCBP12n]|uniref:DMT family transporter n=1 Tax=Flavobacterium pygoscelis TaxID=2893176 RepID=A0A9X1XT44_9FLAO|nr:DMT family transporter [Flavobacterium pygoscelis]MCK8142757.1 DMT family transporter [Flavobacterium pygoscelis]MCK8143345.1 DMT family transporter [Flavobacterium pygoscelis]